MEIVLCETLKSSQHTSQKTLLRGLAVVVVVVVVLVLVVAVLVVIVVGTQGANEGVTMNMAQYSSDVNCSLVKNRCNMLVKVEKLNAESFTRCTQSCTVVVGQFGLSVVSNRM